MLTKKQADLIEKIGIYFEQGMPPAAARVMALMIVSDEEAYSFDSIREALKLSKSATSNAINFLIGSKKIEYFTRSGERKRYFKWCPMNIISHFKDAISKVLELSALFDEAIKNKQDQNSDNYKKLTELTDLMNFLHRELPAIYQKWELGKSQQIAPK